MAYSLISNKKNLAVTLHVASANVNLAIAGNTSQSNVAISNETLTGAAITQIFWGTDSGAVRIYRGSNVVITCTQTGHMDFAASGMSLTKDQGANLVVNFDSANGFALIELQKVVVPTSNSEYFQN